MSFLTDLNETLSSLGISIETGIFKGKAPDRYIVITPMEDELTLFADNLPSMDIQSVRISLFSRDNAGAVYRKMTRLLLSGGFTVTYRSYNGYDTETGYHQWTADAARENEFSTEDT